MYSPSELNVSGPKLNYPHGLRILVREKGEKGGEAAKAGRKQDKEGELLLRVDRNLVEHRQQLAVSTL